MSVEVRLCPFCLTTWQVVRRADDELIDVRDYATKAEAEAAVQEEPFMTRRRNPTQRAVLDPDHDRVTFAVTFAWRRPFSLDKCEAGALPQAIARAIRDASRDDGPLGPWVQLAALESVRTWDPAEEVELGRYVPRIPLHQEATDV